MDDETPVVPAQPVEAVPPMPDHMDMVPPPAKPANPSQEFLNEYKTLCDKYGLLFSASPVYVETNHQTFELSIQIKVVKKQQQ